MNQKWMVSSLAACLAAGALGCGPTQKEAESSKADAPAPGTPCPEGQVRKDTQCIPAPAAPAASAPACPEGQVAKDGACVKAPLVPDASTAQA